MGTELRIARGRGPTILLLVGLTTMAITLGAQEVRLPLADYHQLLERARLDPLPAADPAAPAALESAAIEIELQERTALVTSLLEVAVLAEGWQTLPLPNSGQILDLQRLESRNTTSDELELRLQADGKALLVRGRGRHRLQLQTAHDLGVSGESTRPRRELRLTLPFAGHVGGTLSGHGTDELFIQGGGTRVPADSATNSAVEWVASPGQTLVVIALGDSVLQGTDELPLRFSSTVRSELQLTQLRRALLARVVVNVLQGTLLQLEVELPDGYRLQRVNDQALAGWDVINGTLQLRLLRPAMGRFSVDFEMEAEDASIDTVTTPELTVRDALRSRHLSLATVTGDGILSLVDPGSGIELEAQERSPQKMATPSSSATRQSSPVYQVLDSDQPVRWRLVWPDQTEVLALRVDSLLLDAVIGAAGEAIYNLQLVVASRGPQDLHLLLPTDFSLVRAERDGNRLRPGLSAGGALVLPLRSGSEHQRFSVVGTAPIHRIQELAGRNPLVLEVPSTNAPITEVFVRAQLPDAWRYEIIDSERVVPQSAFSPEGALLEVPPGFLALHASWSALSNDPGDLAVRVIEERQREEWF